ncbi:MAG: metallophosphoesterase [Candidatus Bathyarchaeota archaeon]
MTFLNSSNTGGLWTVFFEVPSGVRPGLFDLELIYNDGGAVELVQPRSIWALEEWPDSLQIAHISDIHLPYGAEIFADYIYEANLVDPDLIITTGDIVDMETIASSWTYLQDLTARLGVPIFLLPGNHDYAGADSELYQKYGGLRNYTVVIGDILFMALDSHGGGYVLPEQLAWAERVLESHPDKVKFIGFHHALLSSEYEDDQGRVRGGAISGNWFNIEGLREVLYSTWADNIDLAEELLRLIQTYDVRLILAGHVHRDIIYILNDEHYFVTTSTTGGSLPPTFNYCSRLIQISSNGNITLDGYAQRQLFDPPNSIPTGELTYWYAGANNGSGTAVSAMVVNDLEVQLTGAKLEFLVSNENPVGSYRFYNGQPKSIEVVETDAGHLFVVHVDVPAEDSLSLTLAGSQDTIKPSIEIWFPSDYQQGTPVPIKLDVSDTNWGVKSVTASYSLDDGSTWTAVDTSIQPTVNKDRYTINIPEASFNFIVANVTGATTLLIRAEALDFSGNSQTAQAEFSVQAPEPVHYTLTVTSSPFSGIPLTVEGETYRTPYSESLEEDNYMVGVPETVEIDGVNHTFMGWSDGETDSERVVDLSSDTDLDAEYEEVVVEEPEPEPETETEPESEPEPEEPRGGIPIPYISVIIGLLMGVAVLALLRRR